MFRTSSRTRTRRSIGRRVTRRYSIWCSSLHARRSRAESCLRYQFTTGPRLLQALELPEQCPPDYPQATAWKRGVAVLEDVVAAIAARHGEQLAAEACGDPVRRLAAIYRDGLTC
jgi:hypothetical protein